MVLCLYSTQLADNSQQTHLIILSVRFIIASFNISDSSIKENWSPIAIFNAHMHDN